MLDCCGCGMKIKIQCNHQQLSSELDSDKKLCDTGMWKRAIQEFNSKSVYWKFLKEEREVRTEYGFGSYAISILTIVGLFFVMRLIWRRGQLRLMHPHGA